MKDNLEKLIETSSLKESFQQATFPTKKTEEWIYTNPTLLFEGLSKVHATETVELPKKFEHQLTFINGELDLNQSNLPKGISIEVSEKSQPLLDESTYLLQAGLGKTYSINVEDKFYAEAPLSIVKWATNSDSESIIPLNLEINVGRSAKLTLSEVNYSEGESSNLQSDLTVYNVAENSTVELVRVIPENFNSRYLGTMHARVQKDSTFNSLTMTLGGKVVRHHLYADILGENATANVHGLFLVDHEQHCDTFSQIKHLVPRTYSSQIYKGTLSGESRGAFTGKLFIDRDAQEVDANQLSKNLLLSPKAHIDTRPQLEVYADDVKAAHGATVGQIGEEEIFYLQSRGIPAEEAFKMLCHGFAMDVIELINDSKLKEFLVNILTLKEMTQEKE